MKHIPQLDRLSGSWVVLNKETNEAVCELYSLELVEKLNFEKYKPVAAHQYLIDLNRKMKYEQNY